MQPASVVPFAALPRAPRSARHAARRQRPPRRAPGAAPLCTGAAVRRVRGGTPRAGCALRAVPASMLRTRAAARSSRGRHGARARLGAPARRAPVRRARGCRARWARARYQRGALHRAAARAGRRGAAPRFARCRARRDLARAHPHHTPRPNRHHRARGRSRDRAVGPVAQQAVARSPHHGACYAGWHVPPRCPRGPRPNGCGIARVDPGTPPPRRRTRHRCQSCWPPHARRRCSGGRDLVAAPLRRWLLRALQLDRRGSFESTADAQAGLDDVLSEEGGYVAAPIALESFLVRYQEHAAMPPRSAGTRRKSARPHDRDGGRAGCADQRGACTCRSRSPAAAAADWRGRRPW